MKTRLTHVSPIKVAQLQGIFGFIVGVLVVIFAFIAIGPGRTVNLNGFVKLTFTGSLDPIGIVLAYPFLNAIAGYVLGFVITWLFNQILDRIGGIEILLDQPID